MKFIVPILLLVLIFWECNVFKRHNHNVFMQIFSLSQKMAVLLTTLLLVVLIGPQRDNLLSVIVLVVVVPLYILRRHTFINICDPERLSISRYVLLSDGIGLVIKWLFTITVISMLTNALMMMYPSVISEFGEVIFSAAISSLVIFIFIYRASQKLSPNGFFASVSLIAHERSRIRLFLIPVIVGLMFASLSAFLLVSRSVQPQTPLSEVMQTADSSLLILFFLFLGLGVAPFVEEITFRGYFFHIVEKIKGRKFAFLSISLTFGILHVSQYWGDWLAIVIVGALGFVLTFLRIWANSCVASVVTHYTYNIGVTIFTVIFFILSNPSYFEYQVNMDKYDKIQKETLLLESIEARPTFYEAYNDLAWLYAQEDFRVEEALELIDQALMIDPDNKAYLDTKMAVLKKLKRFEEAEEIQERIK